MYKCNLNELERIYNVNVNIPPMHMRKFEMVNCIIYNSSAVNRMLALKKIDEIIEEEKQARIGKLKLNLLKRL